LNTNIEIKDEIKKIFFAVFQNMNEQEFSWGKQQKDFENWDSFAQLNLITLVEAKFDISFSLDEATEIKSANELFECIKSHLT
jgi:acyl carrier protein|tara:strand:+ start:1113 stop:1361 length:249 start_codon:yes stop_codon:yes gene_type:complete